VTVVAKQSQLFQPIGGFAAQDRKVSFVAAFARNAANRSDVNDEMIFFIARKLGLMTES
jgi:hypothetical protein